MRRATLRETLSLNAEGTLAAAEQDIRRRLVVGGLAGAAVAFAGRSLLAETLPAGRTTTAPSGFTRTVLESYTNPDGEVFELILDIFPPGMVVPVHHHPVVAFNYVLEGMAESQYQGQERKRLTAGQSFTDHAVTPHILFRNLDASAPLKVLITHTLKPGQEFLIIP